MSIFVLLPLVVVLTALAIIAWKNDGHDDDGWF